MDFWLPALISRTVCNCLQVISEISSVKQDTQCGGHNQDLFFPLYDGFVFFVYCGTAGDLRLGPRS